DPRKVRELRDKLAKPVILNKGIDANTPLKDALEFLGDRYELAIRIDTKAFRAAGVGGIEDQPVRLQRLSGVTLDRVLTALLTQVGGGYVVRGDGVEVTTRQRALAENQPRDPSDRTPRVSLGAPQWNLLKELSTQEAQSSQDVSNIMDDMQAYFER